MRNIFLSGTLVLLTGTATAALADTAPAPDGVWTGKGQFGFLNSTGNTQSTAVNANLAMSLTEGPWTHSATLGGLYGKTAGITSAERVNAGWQSNYALSPDLFVFGGARYEHDEFDGFQYQASGTVGVGYKLINTDTTKLSAQLGAGYRSLRPEQLIKAADGEVISRIPGATEGNAIATGGVDFSQVLTSTTTLTDKFLVESGSDNTLLHNELAVAVKVSNKLALSVGYTLNDNTKPTAGLKKLDSVETVNLVYAF